MSQKFNPYDSSFRQDNGPHAKPGLTDDMRWIREPEPGYYCPKPQPSPYRGRTRSVMPIAEDPRVEEIMDALPDTAPATEEERTASGVSVLDILGMPYMDGPEPRE